MESQENHSEVDSTLAETTCYTLWSDTFFDLESPMVGIDGGECLSLIPHLPDSCLIRHLKPGPYPTPWLVSLPLLASILSKSLH